MSQFSIINNFLLLIFVSILFLLFEVEHSR
jgi:hypothetical protein